MASIAGPPGVWWQDLVASSAMFVLGQIVFVLFGHLINTTCVTRFSFFAEIKKRNAAAGEFRGPGSCHSCRPARDAMHVTNTPQACCLRLSSSL